MIQRTVNNNGAISTCKFLYLLIPLQVWKKPSSLQIDRHYNEIDSLFGGNLFKVCEIIFILIAI